MKEHIEIRQPIVEGLFYPADPEKIKSRVTKLLAENVVEKCNTDTIVVPHGGWDYTGSYIAAGFNSINREHFDKVIIIANVHREFTDTITVPESKYFLIGGKKMRVNLNGIKTIEKNGKKVKKSNIPHMEEHGIECVLPFIQHLYPKAEIIPVLLGKTVVSLVRNLSNIIGAVKDENTLVVVTSNYSDFIREDRAIEIGEEAVSLILEGQLAELVELTRRNKLQTCGAGAIASLILPKDYSEIKLLKAGVSEQTPLSGGKGTYYATFAFNGDK